MLLKGIGVIPIVLEDVVLTVFLQLEVRLSDKCVSLI